MLIVDTPLEEHADDVLALGSKIAAYVHEVSVQRSVVAQVVWQAVSHLFSGVRLAIAEQP